MCGVGWGVVGWGGVGRLWLVTLSTRGTYYICVGWGGVWCGGVGRLKTLWLVTLSTRGTYVWGSPVQSSPVQSSPVQSSLVQSNPAQSSKSSPGWGVVWWGGVGRLKTLLLVTLSTRGTYVWGGVGCGGVYIDRYDVLIVIGICVNILLYVYLDTCACRSLSPDVICPSDRSSCVGTTSMIWAWLWQ